ncbi:MAG: response regulator [Planctomycetales bacterium]|nr:response regulator [Planctomycetales bacterium]
MGNPKSRTILMIDDDRDIVDSTCRRLENEGYRTIAAFDAEQGIDSAVHCKPDAIILDVRMPGMNGINALTQLKQRAETKPIPVVMLSASVVDQNSCLDAGARFFIKKPYLSKHLLAAVDTAMGEIDKNR